MRKLLGALAITLMALIWATPQAEAARCWWNGYTWVCWGPPRPWGPYYGPWRPYYRPWRPYYGPYAYWGPGWGYYGPWRGPRWYW